jgi:hypothetical protein
MTSTLESVAFSQHCPDCGGVFTIDQLQATTNGFRLRLSVENTGEHGTLNLVMDSCRIFALDSRQSDWWIRSYAWWRAQGRTAWELYDKVTLVYGLRPLQEDELPFELHPGQSWSGLFESSRSLGEDAVALIGFPGPFRRTKPHSFMSHMTMDGTRPFISLQGDVTVEPPSIAKKWAGWLVALARCVWRFELLGIFAGGIIGSVADIYLDTRPVFQFSGIPVGWYIFHLLAGNLWRRD